MGIISFINWKESTVTLEKTLYERFLHAVLFEVVALLLCAPVMSWLLGVSFAHAGLLTLMISLVAMAWNVIFNSIFDRLERRWKTKAAQPRGFPVRIAHAVIFEAGLILAVVPMAAWWLGIGLMEAFVLDIGLVLFFLPYTLVFNWCYDKVRAGMLKNAAC
ncbi:multidrug/biocide efflux PACE transporter [Herbaspirillum rhizosphaerae]|uniref:multidrug/biocide efflux PACE transporter n=1 Tax=Herbaspirillum rhizosphaerae TaxID=346179 RepID=UPI00067B1F40|nr:multidrug/biocide efflux PACE transporter [Herbaspirillum rhizosphaerae]